MLWADSPCTGHEGKLLSPPGSPFTFSIESAGRAVVCYIPEGQLLTGGEGKPQSHALKHVGRGEGTGWLSGMTEKGDK